MKQLKKSWYKFFSTTQENSLVAFKEKSLNLVILLLAFFMGISVFFDIQRILQGDPDTPLYVFNVIIYLSFIIIPFLKFLNIDQKSFIFILLLQVIGLKLLIGDGLEGDGRIVLFAVPIASIVLTNRRMSWIILVISTIGFILTAGYKISAFGENAADWISAGAILSLGLIGSILFLINFFDLLDRTLLKRMTSEEKLKSTILKVENEIEERKKSERLTTALYKIAEFAQNSQNIDALYYNVHQVIQELVSAENIYISLYHPETNMLSFPYWVHEIEPPAEEREFSFGFTEEVITQRKPILVTQQEAKEMIADKKGRRGKVETRYPATWLGVPLITTQQEILGVLALQNYDVHEVYTEKDLEIVMFVSSQIAMAIQVKAAAQRQMKITQELEEKILQRTKQLEKELDERRRIEEELLRERQLFIDGPVVSIRWDVDRYFTPTYISPNISRFGYDAEEMASGKLPFRDIIHPDDIQRLDEEIAHYKSIDIDFYEQNFRIISADNKEYWLYDFTSVSRSEDGEITGIDSYFLDISDRIRFESDLKLKTSQQQELIETAQKLNDDLDLEDVLHRIASGVHQILRAYGCIIFRLEPDQRTLIPVTTIDPGNEEANMAASVSVENSLTGQAVRMKRGLVFNDPYSENYFQVPGTPIQLDEKIVVAPFLKDDHVLGAMAVFRNGVDFTADDLSLAETFAAYAATAINNANYVSSLNREIDERKRVENQLDMQANALRATNSPIIITDTEGIIEWVNPAFTKLSGYEYAEIRGRSMSVLKSGKHEFGFYEHLWDTILSGQEWQGEIINKSKMGRYYTVETTINPVWSEDKSNIIHFVAIQQDISEKKQQERERNAFIHVSSELRNAANTAEMSPIILDNLMELLNVKAAVHISADHSHKQLKVLMGRGEWSHWEDQTLAYSSGIPGKVISTQDWYMSNNVQDDPDVKENIELMNNLYHQVCTPLIVDGKVNGMLWAANDVTFTYDEAKILMTISDMASNALSRAYQHEETQLRVERLNTLRQIDLAIAGSSEMSAALNVVADQAVNSLGVDAAAVYVLNKEAEVLELISEVGFDHLDMQAVSLRIDEGLAKLVLGESPMINILDISSSEVQLKRTWLRDNERFTSYFGLPLRAKGQSLGVLEVFTRKAFNPPDSWKDFLITLAGQTAIAIDNSLLFSGLQKSNINLETAYDTTLEGWAKALELRDYETKGHSERVVELALKFGRRLNLDDSTLTNLRRGAVLHDIGKMGIPDHILLKPGPLNDDDWTIVKQHPEFGSEMIELIPFLTPSVDIIQSHHERWDGTGYPEGLAGEDIPLLARLFSIVDVYDALTHVRPYKEAWSQEKAIGYIQDKGGAQFDPGLVEVFLQIIRGRSDS